LTAPRHWPATALSSPSCSNVASASHRPTSPLRLPTLCRAVFEAATPLPARPTPAARAIGHLHRCVPHPRVDHDILTRYRPDQCVLQRVTAASPYSFLPMPEIGHARLATLAVPGHAARQRPFRLGRNPPDHTACLSPTNCLPHPPCRPFFFASSEIRPSSVFPLHLAVGNSHWPPFFLVDRSKRTPPMRRSSPGRPRRPSFPGKHRHRSPVFNRCSPPYVISPVPRRISWSLYLHPSLTGEPPRCAPPAPIYSPSVSHPAEYFPCLFRASVQYYPLRLTQDPSGVAIDPPAGCRHWNISVRR
jgi:hypothetical protein